MLGCEYVVQCLEKEGVDTIFGYPGGAVIPLFDALYDHETISVYRPAHEQGGTHAADGYARVTGRPGVMIVTSGPGLTNAVTGIANAFLDSVPLVVIAGQVASSLLGRDSFQEVNTSQITKAITKANFLVTGPDEIKDALRMAFHIAKSGRPGPVVVDITKNAFTEEVADTSYVPMEIKKDRRHLLFQDQIDEAAKALRNAKRPIIYAGGGVLKSGATQQLKALAEEYGIPVVNSIMGLSSFDRRSPLSFGLVGMHGDKETNLLVYNADVILGLGVRFSDRAIGNRQGFSKEAQIIHVDTDEKEFDKNVDVQYRILGNLPEIIDMFREKLSGARYAERTFQDEAAELQKGFLPTVILDALQQHFPEDTILVTDVGQHQMWSARRWKFVEPKTFVSSGGLGTMGFGLGAAIGAKIGRPDREVLLITGDGSFRMDHLELLTARTYDVPLTVVVFNNHALGMVRQWQTLFNEKRYSHTDIYDALDIEALCRAYDVHYEGAFSNAEELHRLFENFNPKQGVHVLEFLLDHDMAAIPMVAAGDSIDRVIETMA